MILDDLAKNVIAAHEFQASALPSGGHWGNWGGEKFAQGLNNSGVPININHALLRANGRRAYHDSPQVRTIVDRQADTIADTGLTLEMTPNASLLGITPEVAEAWGNDIENRFHLFASSSLQHRSEGFNLYQAQRLWQVQQHRDNDIFARLYYSDDSELLNPLQFEFIDADQIRGDAYTDTDWTGTTDSGIKRDSRGREKSFDIWVKDSDGGQRAITIPKKHKNGRINMIHSFQREYAGQVRGYSRIGHILQESQGMTDFALAHIQKAISQSVISMAIKPSKDEDGINPLHDISMNNGGLLPSDIFGSAPSAAPSGLEIAPVVSYNQIPEAPTLGSVGVFNVTKGAELVPFNNTAPGDNYDSFVNAFFTHLSASTGMPVEIALMKFGQNYSASRATLLLYWRLTIMWRQQMVYDFLNPILEMWLAGEIAAGRVKAFGWQDPILKAAWLNSTWNGSPIPNIDPSKTAKATEIHAKLGLTTLDRESRNLNGSSGATNRAKLAREYDELPLSPYEQTDFGDGTTEEGK